MENHRGKRILYVVLAGLAIVALAAAGVLLTREPGPVDRPGPVASEAPPAREEPGPPAEAGAAPETSGDAILIGGIMDTTGATSDVGKDYALGMEEAFAWVNENGGINGKPVKYVWFDYGYRVPEAVAKYQLLKRMGASVIMGWGTGDTEALSSTVNKDRIPYVSASYSAHLTDPSRSRYNIFFAPDYSSAARACLTAWFETRWAKHPDYGKRPPRLMCAYMFTQPYCSSPIRALKDQAKLLGFQVGDDQDVSLFALDAKAQVGEMMRFKPDAVWHGNTTMSVGATIRDARAMGLAADFLVNTWGFDENLPRQAGESAQGVMGVTPCGFFGQDFPNMDRVTAQAARYNPGIPSSRRLIRSVQAWADALITVEAIRRAQAAGDLSGQGILTKGFETLKSFDFGLGAAPVTFTQKDHRPTSLVLVQEYAGGKFNPVATVDLAERWPGKWAREWLGW